jgi:hypothetical protein
MTVTYHRKVVQGSTEWLEMRRGILTASEMRLIVTPATLKAANNDKAKAHLYTLMAQRLAGYVEPGYQGDDMLRGHEDEIDARFDYQTNYAPLENCGFITNDRWGFTIGYSPDGLVNDDPEGEGLIEIKSRKHALLVKDIIEAIGKGQVPADFMVQVQTGLLVSERNWLDFMDRSAGLPMPTLRIYPDPKVQAAIVDIATDFEISLANKMLEFKAVMGSGLRLLATERREEKEIHL